MLLVRHHESDGIRFLLLGAELLSVNLFGDAIPAAVWCSGSLKACWAHGRDAVLSRIKGALRGCVQLEGLRWAFAHSKRKAAFGLKPPGFRSPQPKKAGTSGLHFL